MRLYVLLGLMLSACGPATRIGGDLGVETEQSNARSGQQVETEESSEPGSCVEPTLGTLRAEVLVPACGGCHAGDDPAENLDLTLELADLRMRLLQPAAQSPSGTPLVTPGSIGASYLYLKVALKTPLIGNRMPRAAEPLEECTIESLHAWIEAGAN